MRLIKVVCGEPYGDGTTVTDIGIGYAEPGYHDHNTVWVLGDWNPKQHFESFNDGSGAGRWITDNDTPERLFKALERIGVECEWSDEWGRCSHCQRIIRTSGDSYMWKPHYVLFEDGDYLCLDCAMDPDFVEDVLELFVNHSNRIVTVYDEEFLTERGWVRYNEHPYERGMHPGMNADPTAIRKEVEEELPNHDYLFYLDEPSQFYIRFSVFTREKETEE